MSPFPVERAGVTKEDLAKMQDMYGRLGRLYATVTPDPQFSEKPGEAVLVYQNLPPMRVRLQPWCRSRRFRDVGALEATDRP